MLSTILLIVKMLLSPLFLFSVAVIILIIYACKGGTSFLNINKVFIDYFSIFKDAKRHLLIFWGVPALLSAALTQMVEIGSSLAEILIVFLSILISAFFAMLSILVSKQADNAPNELYNLVLKETASTVLLEIILCIISLLISLGLIFFSSTCPHIVSLLLSALNYYLISVIILNILILVKRFKSLIDNA